MKSTLSDVCACVRERECVVIACTLVHNVHGFASVKLLVCDSVNDLSCIILVFLVLCRGQYCLRS